MASAGTLRATRRLARFGAFEFDAAAQEFRKHGLRLKLQGKPMQLLAALLERPGDVLSREELQRRLWPADTFVDFENGLNTAAKRLRAAMSDSADQPVYVETVARAGYRFIAPVVWEEPLQQPVMAPVVSPDGRLVRRSAAGWRVAIVAALATVAGAAGAWRILAPPAAGSQPTFRQVTFRRGPVFNARFGPDGQSIVYAAQWDGTPRQLYVNDGVSPEARPLGLTGSLFSVSRSGELALYRYTGTMPITGGDLLCVAMNGGVPAVIEKSVMSADWAPDGRQVAITRAAGGRNTLEYPPGRVLYSTPGWLSGVRFSPSGDRIAVVDHPVRHDDGGRLLLVDLGGRFTALTAHWTVLSGLAWRPDGAEVWFSGAQGAAIGSLWAASRTGKLRQLGQFPGVIRLRDVSASGAVLVGRESRRLESFASFDGQPTPRDVSWLDWSRAVDVSKDGRVLLDESGEAVGGQGTVFLFDAAKGTQKLGEGWAQALSPDGRHALILSAGNRKELRTVSLTGAGEAPLALPGRGLEYQWVRYFPDGRTLLALASLDGQPLRMYRIPPEPGVPPVPISPPGMVRDTAISPDGAQVAYLTADGKLTLAPSGRVLAQDQALAPLRWTGDGRRIFVQHLSSTAVLPVRVSLMDVSAGSARMQPWREFSPRDPVGVDQLTRILIAPDERTTGFTVRRILSELFVARVIR